MRNLRAVLIVVALLANATYALPVSKMKAEEVDDPEFRANDVELWYRWLGAPLGVTREAFGARIRRLIWAQHELVLTLRAPFGPVFETLHISQQWGLFAVVTEAPDRLVIEVRREGEWETLYRRLDGQHDWHDSQLKYRRIRGVWDGVKEEPKGTYKRLTTWVARVIFAEQPDVDRVRVVLEKEPQTLPWVENTAETTRRAERYHRREEM
jgi:hypothetical protein